MRAAFRVWRSLRRYPVYATQADGRKTRIVYCGPRYHVYRHDERRVSWWRVAGISWSLQVGRMQFQRIHA